MESGSSVKFTWVIDYLEIFAHEGQSYSVVFKKPAEYKLRVRSFSCLYDFIFVIILYVILRDLFLGDSFQPCELPEPTNPPDCG